MSNCTPQATGLTQSKIDNLVFSVIKNKQDIVKGWCATCSITDECLAQGSYYNVEGTRVLAEGIFGGLSQNERRAIDSQAGTR